MKPKKVSIWTILGGFLLKLGLFVGAVYFLIDVFDSSKKLIFGKMYQGQIHSIAWTNRNAVKGFGKSLQYEVRYSCQKQQASGFIAKNCYLITKDTLFDLGKKVGEQITVFRNNENYDEKAVIFNNNFTDYLNVFIIPTFLAASFLLFGVFLRPEGLNNAENKESPSNT